jgi:hypothetical protein
VPWLDEAHAAKLAAEAQHGVTQACLGQTESPTEGQEIGRR